MNIPSWVMTVLGVMGAGVGFLLTSGEISGTLKLVLGTTQAMIMAAMGFTHPGTGLSASDARKLIAILVLGTGILVGVHGCVVSRKVPDSIYQSAGAAICRQVPADQRAQAQAIVTRLGLRTTEDLYTELQNRASLAAIGFPEFYGKLWATIHRVLDNGGITDPNTWQHEAARIARDMVDGCLADLQPVA